MQMDRLLDTIVQTGASDLHLTVGRPPTVRLHGSAAERAAAIGIAAIAVSITHEREYAVAVAYGQRAVREA
jgi:phosphopantetheinyl transferase (holo-ACP synthase)